MLMVAILSWGSDLMIRPAATIEWVRDIKRRLNLKDVDYIVFSSGYLTPIKLDIFTHQLNEEEIIELFGNPSHRHPAWD